MRLQAHVTNAILLSVGLAFILSIGLEAQVTPTASEEFMLTLTQLVIPVVLGALFPDVDTAFGHHRQTLHNLPVLGLFLAFPYYFGNLQFVWIGIATHYLLDVVGSRRGIAFFYPLSAKEYELPTGVATNSRLAGTVTIAVTIFELVLFGGAYYSIPGFEVGLKQVVAVLGN